MTNPLVPLIDRGKADRAVLAALAREQRLVIAADRRSFRHLAQRAAEEPETAAFFALLAEGETLAAGHLEAFAAACGPDATGDHEPLAGCQAYPAYVAWLALNGAPADVLVALTANFAEWGGYCATVARALRDHYGFPDEACAFFDFFAEPSPELERRASAALRSARPDQERARRYGRLLQEYEGMFWRTLLQSA
ncbi:transcriptional regulator [Streptomyces sp. CC219B]|uniref:transcriptional regulator n=1 Tax=Streptomyces sp. CC219B TaxID=3044574 RepID=UPI0024A7EE6C|nr:transcriptional regulator [Streptomyces sp. CC219B]